MLHKILEEVKKNNGIVHKQELIQKFEIESSALDGMLMVLHNSGRIKIKNIQETLEACSEGCSLCSRKCF